MRFAALFLFLVGCTHNTEPAKPDPAADARSARELSNYMAQTRPLPALGTACSSGPTCGTAQRISLHLETVSRAVDFPCNTVGLREPSATEMENRLGGCMVQDRVYLVDACMYCRVTSNTLVQAEITELTAPQREYLRSRFKLPEGAKLESRSDWERVLAKK